MLAVIVVREGQLAAGAEETISECAGRVMLVGSDTAAGAEQAQHVATHVTTIEMGDFRPAAWAAALARPLAEEPMLVLPASPDGRDLAPRLAAVLRRPLYAVAMAISPNRIDLVRGGGSELHVMEPHGSFVATLQPRVRGVDERHDAPSFETVELAVADRHDATVEEVLPADPTSIDLAEAGRIVAGGAGLDGPERFDQLARLGEVLAASIGATRVITDRGWVAHERQIGTTGVTVDPQLYMAFGISGAVQHTSGLGDPDHIISVNTDPHCPMMQLADLAVVADTNLVLDQLLEQLPEKAAAHGG